MQDDAVTHQVPDRRWELWVRQVLIGSWLMKSGVLLRPVAWLWRRLMFRTTFVAITGSLGKTTAKELLAAILRRHASTSWTIGNQNGPLFVCTNILRVRPWHRYAVLEVAGAAPGIMQRSAPIVRPDLAVMLTIRRTHSTSFASLDEHAREKSFLPAFTRPHGTVALFEDDPRVSVMRCAPTHRIVRFGTSPTAHLRARNVSAQWPERLTFDLDSPQGAFTVRTQLVGEHWLHAVLGALAAATALGVPLQTAVDSIATVPPFRGRLQPVALPNGAIMLRDDYNASLDGSDAAFQVMRTAKAERRILVFSDLSDFGGNRTKRLRYVSALLPSIASFAVFIGENVDYGVRRAVEAGMPADAIRGFATLHEAAEFLKHELRNGDLVLLKGRTTDHLARLCFAQYAQVACWKVRCPKTMLCDECWELGLPPSVLQLSRAPRTPA